MIRLLPPAHAQVKYVIMAINYFTKWVEAKLSVAIIEDKMNNFIWKSIICRFRIPRTIVTDNVKQFDNGRF